MHIFITCGKACIFCAGCHADTKRSPNVNTSMSHIAMPFEMQAKHASSVRVVMHSETRTCERSLDVNTIVMRTCHTDVNAA